MKKVVFLFILTLCLFSKDLNIYVMDQTHLNNTNKIEKILPKSNSVDVAIVDGIDGSVIYRGKGKNIPTDVVYLEPIKKDEIKKVETPYTIESIYKMILPTDYEHINIYFINSIFYKNQKFDFEKGAPSDAFLVSENSEFTYIDKFSQNIKSYIFVSDGYFVNNEHKEGLKRFYYLLFKKLNLNLQTFNSNFSKTPEKFNFKPISKDSLSNSLKVSLTPPKKIHYQDDEYNLNYGEGILRGYIKNKIRANTNATIYLNNQEHTISCDKDGICRFKLKLKLGNNTFKFKTINNKDIVKTFKSNYIPNDIPKYSIYKEDNKVYMILEPIKSYRPANSTVVLYYKNENKDYNTTVDSDGYYKFKIPLKYINNTFILKQYNGTVTKINIVNDILKKKEEERIRKLQEEKRKKALEELKKQGLKKIDKKKVKKYKGKNGDPRIILSWYTTDDVDLKVIDPCGNTIDYDTQYSICQGKKGVLDIDANVNHSNLTKNPQENITWENGGVKGKYKIIVHVASDREHLKEIPITLTIVNNGQALQKKEKVSKNQDFSMYINH